MKALKRIHRRKAWSINRVIQGWWRDVAQHAVEGHTNLGKRTAHDAKKICTIGE